jgi:hypothetical protein
MPTDEIGWILTLVVAVGYIAVVLALIYRLRK